MGTRTLVFGGIAFAIFGPLYWSGRYNNYVAFDAGSFIAVVILVRMAVPIMIYTWREVQKLPREFPINASELTSQPPEPLA